MMVTQTRTAFPARWFVIFSLIVLAISGVLLAVRTLPTLPPVNTNSHAVERHGSDAVEIRKCLNRNGPEQVWKKFQSDRWILLCRLDDGRLGMQIIQRVGQKYEEITSFVRGNGTMKETLEYLAKQGTRWKGALPK